MNTPPLIRPLRTLLQGRLPLVTARPPLRSFQLSRPQFRANSSQIPDDVKKVEERKLSSEPAAPAATTVAPVTPAAPVTESPVAETPVTPEAPVTEAAPVAPETPATPVAAAPEASSTSAAPPKAEEPAPEVNYEAMVEAAVQATATPEATSEAPNPFRKVHDATSREAVRKAKKEAIEKAKDESGKVDVKRLPPSLELLYLRPLKREAKYGVPTCNLQLRSYSVRNLEFFCDFALRAAYYLGLAASGPVPLPRLTERWTVPKANFIFKKSQENFSRITLRRLIQIKDGHPETVQIWLAFLQKHAYYGIGMKANVWEFSKLGVGKTMDESAKELDEVLESKYQDHLGHMKGLKGVEDFEEFVAKERLKASGGR